VQALVLNDEGPKDFTWRSIMVPGGMEPPLAYIIRRRPNLDIIIVDWPVGERVVDALASSVSSSLRGPHCLLSTGALPKLVQVLPSIL